VTDSASLDHLLGRGAPRAPDQASLEAWGQALGAALPRPAALTFAGDLGAGKTTLVRAICRGLGVRDMAMVTSPTFALIQQYEAESGSVTHVDLYRLRSAAEIDTLGWDELVDTASVLLVEWPDRAGGALPPDAIAIELRHDPEHPDRRLLRVSNRRS
jgi:tRNA threonylcarbamoyl adenosine modification protein YjeE